MEDVATPGSGLGEVPYSVCCSPGCSCLPGQPQGPAGLSHHTLRVCPRVPSRTHWGRPQVLPRRGCQNQLRRPLFLPLVWAFPVFSQKEGFPQLSNSVNSRGSILPPAHHTQGLTEPVCWSWTPDGLKEGSRPAP